MDASKINVVASVFAVFGGILLIFHGYIAPIYGSIESFRLLFIVSTIMMAVSFISLFMLRERFRPRKTTHVMKRESLLYTLRIIGPNIINGAGLGIAIPLLPLWFELRFNITVSFVGEIFTFAYIATAIGSYVSGKYMNTAKFRAITVSSVTRIFQGALLLVIAFSPFVVLALCLYSLRSGIAGLGAPMRSAISVRGIGKEDFGAASSIQGVSTRGSQMTSGAAGYLMDIYFPLPLIIGGVLQVGGAALYYRLIRNWEKQREVLVSPGKK